MEYFQQFPNLFYSFDPDSMDFYLVKNLFARVKLLDAVLENGLVYYPYSVKDTDTIESISHKYYGDTKKHWIVMFSNKIVDPYFDFPLNTFNLENNIIKKYGDLTTAKSITHHVEQNIVTTTNFRGNVTTTTSNTTLVDPYSYDFSTNALLLYPLPGIDDGSFFLGNNTSILDDGTIVDQGTTLIPISNYDYEVNLNESRRQIQLLDKAYASVVEQELKNLLGI